ncbi:hypothetical protein [Streptomyces brasiliensis]|uniref:Transposase n=1 Tax=Streptomyces brasiliensis TaxID=1954 RepID=A0A917P7K3_9ACTN|nr:hypothetical protein [Streptomyces brasiliensis]GGJ65609.1 hypothetical protein GCM10010121_090300 [Streptomyces brasiliensis]
MKDESPADGFTHWLVLRRSLHPNRRGKDGRLHREITYFLAHAPAGATLSQIIARAGGHWQIEEDNEINKQLVGLARYQVRKWTPWHRHVTACMLATAFLSVQHATLSNTDTDTEHDLTAGKDQVTSESEAAGQSTVRFCGPPATPSGTAWPPPDSIPGCSTRG